MLTRMTLILALSTLAFAGAANADTKADLDALKGTWTCTGLTFDTKEQPLAEIGKIQLVIDGESYKVLEGDKGETESGKLKLDASKTPKEWDFEIDKSSAGDNGKKQLAVYKLEGDSLTYTAGEPGSPDRPKAVGAAAHVLHVQFKKGAAEAAPSAAASPSPAPSPK